jgi:hypothetical protein
MDANKRKYSELATTWKQAQHTLGELANLPLRGQAQYNLFIAGLIVSGEEQCRPKPFYANINTPISGPDRAHPTGPVQERNLTASADEEVSDEKLQNLQIQRGLQ